MFISLFVATLVLVSPASDPSETCLVDFCTRAENEETRLNVSSFAHEVIAPQLPGNAEFPDQVSDYGASSGTVDDAAARAQQEAYDAYQAQRAMLLCTDDVSPMACGSTAPTPTDAEDAAPVEPSYPTVIFASDLVSFTPDPPGVSGEPENIGLVGKTVNIVASSAEHTQSGLLLGFPVTVVFTPASYTFDYGDGTVVTTQTGGISWASLGVPQFSDAPTAHAYAQRGGYTASITTNYTATVAFADGIWRPVTGTVAATATYPVQIYVARTALVNEDCNQNPDGIGCP